MTGIEGRIGTPVIVQVHPVVDHSVRGLCPRPYPGHPKGCPNFGQKDGCPPMAPMIENVLDLEKPVFLVAVSYDLAGHVAEMGERHPGWTAKQRANCLYWQGAVRARLFETARHEAYERDLIVVKCPEANGIDMTATFEDAWIILEWPPKKTVWKAVLLGTPRSAA